MNQSTPTAERVSGPAPHLSAFLDSEGGESDAYKHRYGGLDPSIHVGPFAMAQYKRDDRTFLVDNVTQSQWTKN